MNPWSVLSKRQKSTPEIENLYGAVNAVAGVDQRPIHRFEKISADTLKRSLPHPARRLAPAGTSPTRSIVQKILDVFKKRNVRYFFYIGGNDSANTLHIINTIATKTGYELRAFHIPKTIDNDLLVTDHCPGYGTAAKFEACALIGDDLDNRSLPGIKIDVIMGRNAGFLLPPLLLGNKETTTGHTCFIFPKDLFRWTNSSAISKACIKNLADVS